MRHLYRTKRNPMGTILPIAAFLAVLALFFVLLGDVNKDTGARGQAQLANAIRRAAVTCYAVEGRYPPTLAYLCDNYGVHIDGEAYIVRYDAFASNLMPEITVVGREAD